MISSIPSTIVRPLQESGTPAGPSFTGITSIPAGPPQRVPYVNPFPQNGCFGPKFGGGWVHEIGTFRPTHGATCGGGGGRL